jgi:uncharacterized Zn finger protein
MGRGRGERGRGSGYYDDRYYPHYPRSQPRPAAGIKAKGTFGSSWWAKRWIEALESLGIGSRLTRGRSYARKGQVLDIELKPGQVKAKVQGSQPRPYRVSIELPPLSDEQWARAIDAMAGQAIFAARLLAGEMPQNIEEAFNHAGVPLFPQRAQDLVTDCSCPDWENPCKHIAAVYYLLGERFDEDPFLIFQLRGRNSEQIVEALRARRAATGQVGEDEASAQDTLSQAEPVAQLADLLDSYYEAGSDLEAITTHIVPPEVEAALLKRLGTPPANTEADLRALYAAMSRWAQDKVFGDSDSDSGKG